MIKGPAINYDKNKFLKKPKIITAIGMFYDLEEPNKFISDAADSLHKDGIFIAQLMCLKQMIENQNFNDVFSMPLLRAIFCPNSNRRYIFIPNSLKINI